MSSKRFVKKSFLCDICLKMFDKESSLKMHSLRVHPKCVAVDKVYIDSNVNVVESVPVVSSNIVVLPASSFGESAADYLEHICTCNGLRVSRTVGGGDCFYHAVQLGCQALGSIHIIRELRRMTANQLELHSADYKPLYRIEHKNQARSFELFVKNTRIGNEWCTELSVAACVRAINKVIRVIGISTGADGRPMAYVQDYSEGIELSSDVIVVGYKVDEKHYVGLGVMSVRDVSPVFVASVVNENVDAELDSTRISNIDSDKVVSSSDEMDGCYSRHLNSERGRKMDRFKRVKGSLLCELCERMFKTEKGLRLHQRLKHNISQQAAISSDDANDSMNVDLNEETSMSVDASLNASCVSMSSESGCDVRLGNGKTVCQYCNKCFVNISNHKVCPRRDMNAACSTEVATVSNQLNSNIINVSFNENLNEYMSAPSAKNQLCEFCKKYFVDLKKHNKCRARSKSVNSNTSNTNLSDSDSCNELVRSRSLSPICNVDFNVPLNSPRRSPRLSRSSSSSIDSANVSGNNVEFSNVMNAENDSQFPKRERKSRVPYRKRLTHMKRMGHRSSSPSSSLNSSISSNCNALNTSVSDNMSDTVSDQEVCSSDVPNSNHHSNNVKKSYSDRHKDDMNYIKKLEEKLFNKVKHDNPFIDKSAKPCKDKDKSAKPRKDKGNKSNPLPIPPDLLLQELDEYCKQLWPNLTNTATLKTSPEVLELVKDPAVMDDEKRPFVCPPTDLDRLTALTDEVKNLRVPSSWGWAATDDSDRGKYNHARLACAMNEQLKTRINRCKQCHCTTVLIGVETAGDICRDCRSLNSKNPKFVKRETDLWNKVRPTDEEFPRRIERGHTDEYLPDLTDKPGTKAAISPVFPVVTVKKNYFSCKKYRQESISLLQDPDLTWANILPRTDLKDRFMIIERTGRDGSKRYIMVDAEEARQWLLRLRKTHEGIKQMIRDGKLEISEEAFVKLAIGDELAEVDNEYQDTEVLLRFEKRASDEEAISLEGDVGREDRENGANRDGTATSTMQPVFSENHTFALEKLGHLYVKHQDVLKLQQGGKISVLQDNTARPQKHHLSATMAFPYLYPDEKDTSPLDCGDWVLATKLLKKQALFAHYKKGGPDQTILVWRYASDDIHMMHQYAKLQEMAVCAKVGFYLHQHPEKAHIPIKQALDALKEGENDQGYIDSHLPGLAQVMAQLPHTRERWFSERLGVECISRDLGEPNLFLTLSNEPRADKNCRELLYHLEHGQNAVMPPNYYEQNTTAFTKLADKHAIHLATYLERRAQVFIDAFLCDVCGVTKKPLKGDWSKRKREENSWYFARVEFTESRGFPHYHVLAKLPGVMDISMIGRLVQNGRVIRQEWKCGNIKQESTEKAWKMIRAGQIAQRYAILFQESLSTAAFYSESMPIDQHDENLVINLDRLRREYVRNYTEGKITEETHPLMRKFGSEHCNKNSNIEMAKVAAVCQIHQCMPNTCGGNEKTGEGCRFDYPKKKLKRTVVAMVQVNSEQMEARVLSRRTHERVNTVNKYLSLYWRSNHDVQVLIDAAHSKRYVTKYATKSSKHSDVMREVLEHINKRNMADLPQNLKHVLIHVLLADCSQRTFVSKHEIAYKVAGCFEVLKSYADVNVISCYDRASLLPSRENPGEWVYSDRTVYAAYAERCNESTKLKGLSAFEVRDMNLRDFCECVNAAWKKHNNDANHPTNLDKRGKHKLRTNVEGSGHWILSKRRDRAHSRPSVPFYTDLAADYEPSEGDSTEQGTSYMQLPVDKRKQLARAYYELIMYKPWVISPDNTFLTPELIAHLTSNDTEGGQRYSFMRLEEYFKVYSKVWAEHQADGNGSLWKNDNISSYTMFLVHGHNSDVKIQRAANEGRFNAQFEPAEDLAGTEIDVRPSNREEGDDFDYPSALNFLPADNYREILDQTSPAVDDIAIAYPTQHSWQSVEELVKCGSGKRFMCDPPVCVIPYDSFTEVQKWACDLVLSGREQVVYLHGRAGSGKSTVALYVLDRMRGISQAGACTAKASTAFNGPTVHGMFSMSLDEFSDGSSRLDSNSPKIQDLRLFYANTELFVVDEVMGLAAATLGMLDEIMTLVFNPERKRVNGRVPPFGGKRMLFLGDPSQLRPVIGPAIYDDMYKNASVRFLNSLQGKRAKIGQSIYQDYMKKNVVVFMKGHRCKGLLGVIADALRDGRQTDEDLKTLLCRKRIHTDVSTDRGIHYDNDSCETYNCMDLWSWCKSRGKRMYVCRASYHDADDNQMVIDGLSSLPAKVYQYAPHLLWLAEGCEVRLVRNLNVAAGLVNSAVGTVVKIVYANADAKDLLEGKHPSPYAVIVSFESFRGFSDSDDPSAPKRFPFPRQPSWVPIYREKFTVVKKDLPQWILKKQLASECYRLQFPLSLSRHITAHRAQGATMRDCLISVDLGLDNPTSKLTNDITSVLYVAITRAVNLKDLFVSPIHPEVWAKLGRDVESLHRQAVDKELCECAKTFAAFHGQLDLVETELTPTDRDFDEQVERVDLCSMDEPVSRLAVAGPLAADNNNFVAEGSGILFNFCLKPVLSERHVGIDQGCRNFAIAVVDNVAGKSPKIVSVKLYDLGLPNNFNVIDLVLALKQQTDLCQFMQLPGEEELSATVDRVVVHLEQMSVKNKNSKKFGVELGQTLQRLAPDPAYCVVKLSSPNVHRPGGPSFKLGEQIVQALNLRPASYRASKKRATDGRLIADENTTEYKFRKDQSAKIFKYIVEADEGQLRDMNLEIDPFMQIYWRQQMALSGAGVKLDDCGDSLLHSLNDILCSSSNYRQLVPTAPSLMNNRTVVLSLFPDICYFVVIFCSWNSFLIEDFGSFSSKLMGQTLFRSKATVDKIVKVVSKELGVALLNFEGDGLYTGVEHIKVVIKQQTRTERAFATSLEAGSLTNSTVAALKKIADNAMSKTNSKGREKRDKTTGYVYLHIHPASGKKYQVMRSTGKHTNAILNCLNFMSVNLKSFVEQRRQTMNETEKCTFLRGLINLALKGGNRLESIQLAEGVKAKLASTSPLVRLKIHVRNIADIMLISLNKNNQYVKAVAANSRRRAGANVTGTNERVNKRARLPADPVTTNN